MKDCRISILSIALGVSALAHGQASFTVIPQDFNTCGLSRDGKFVYSLRSEDVRNDGFTSYTPEGYVVNTPCVGGTEGWSPTLGKFSLEGFSGIALGCGRDWMDNSGYPFNDTTGVYGGGFFGLAQMAIALISPDITGTGLVWAPDHYTELRPAGYRFGAGTADGKTLFGAKADGIGGATIELAKLDTTSGAVTNLGSYQMPILPGPQSYAARVSSCDAAGNMVGVAPGLWTAPGGFQTITLPDGSTGAVSAISPSGRYILGSARPSSGLSYSFIWSKGTGFIKTIAMGSRITDDMVVSNVGLWTPSLGNVDITSLLQQLNVSVPAGLTLDGVQDMSDDGTVLLVRVRDAAGHFGYAYVTIPRLVAPYDRPGSYSVAHGTTLNVPTPGILQLVTYVSPTTVEVVLPPKHAKSFTLNPDGSFTYTPADGFTGSDGFWYRAHNIGGYGKNAFITINVT